MASGKTLPICRSNEFLSNLWMSLYIHKNADRLGLDRDRRRVFGETGDGGKPNALPNTMSDSMISINTYNPICVSTIWTKVSKTSSAWTQTCNHRICSSEH